MEFFNDKKGKQLEYLEEERKKLWARISKLEADNVNLQKQIQLKASDSEKEAAQSSRKAAEFRNKTEQRANEANTLIGNITSKLDEADTLINLIHQKNEDATISKSALENIEKEYTNTYTILKSKVDTLEHFLTDYPELDDKLEEISQFISTIEDNLAKSKVSLNSLNKSKKEVEDIHREIFGYLDEDDTGNEIIVKGKKEELDRVYQDLHTKLTNADTRITKIAGEYKNSYIEFEQNHKTNYEKINSEIESLLPAALTAGLSSAFSNKKEDEVKSSKELQKRFSLGIYFLIGVSVVPFIVSIVFLVQGFTLDMVITKIPRLVLAIVPMYIPVLWFTYSANKKLNLSKRLIEEYAHKEVLSKTYEGLSKQINNLEDDEQTQELRYRLLSSFLQVTSENPGKLISNYEASDHPVMEALEQSYKFQVAIDKLEGIPGLSKVAAILESNSKKKILEKTESIEKALSSENHEINEEEDEKI